MRAILLCAGFGTRLQPMTERIPKALVPVAGRPLIDYLMGQITSWAPVETVHVVHNARRPEAFADWAMRWRSRGAERGCSITLHNTGVETDDERRGAVGDLRWVIDRVGADAPAVVSGGDSIYRVDLSPVVEQFEQTGRSTVLALRQSDPEAVAHSSVLELDGQRVRGVREAGEGTAPAWISPSFYVLDASALAHLGRYLDRGGASDSLGRFIHDSAQHQPVDACRIEGPDDRAARFHINTPEQHRAANAALAEGPVVPGDG
jgi:NDP-sugar pyrophosphorylase family protein